MSDVAKPAIGNVHGHGVLPVPPPIVPEPEGIAKKHVTISTDAFKTVFDGDDYTYFDPSFDIEGAAARAVAAYDRDGDGSIDLGSADKSVAALLSRETSRLTGSGTSSIAKLAKYADEAGNRDGSATVEEIADVIRRFDQDTEGDGRLTDQERETFLAVFGEERTPFRHRHPSPLPRPIPGPITPPIWHGPELRGPELIGIRPYFRH